MAGKTLFIGNGLNRTLEDGISWDDLMVRLRGRNLPEQSAPFPIEYEALAAQRGNMLGNRGDAYKQLREELSELIQDQTTKGSEVYGAFRNIPFDHFVTTNYDTTFENMYDQAGSCISNIGSARNILDPVIKSEHADFYHAHGVAKWKNTLCLGHDHYASLIGKIRDRLKLKDNYNYSHLRSIILETEKSTRTWPELLFTNDVAIVGLGLDYCEVDLWWLLSLRASIFAKAGGISTKANHIAYYVVDKQPDSKDQAKYDVLDRLGVEVACIPEADYKDGYIKIADRIIKAWSK